MTRGGGGEKSETFADVINGSPLVSNSAGSEEKVKERGNREQRRERERVCVKGVLMEIAIQSETDFVVGLCSKSREEGKG